MLLNNPIYSKLFHNPIVQRGRQYLLNLLAVVVFALIMVYLLGSHRILHTTVINITDEPNAAPVSIELPYKRISAYGHHSVPKGKAKHYKYTIHTMGYTGQRLNWKIKVDDCLIQATVNGTPVPLSKRLRKRSCARWIPLDLTPYTNSGYNKIELLTNDKKGGYYGLAIQQNNMLFNKNLFKFVDLTFIVFAWLIAWFMRSIKFDITTIFICLVAFNIYLWCFRHIGNTDFSPDWWGHIPYISHFATTWWPPRPQAGWETYHPPLYYMTAHIAGVIGESLGQNYLRSARVVSFTSMLAMIFFGMLMIRRVITHSLIQNLCIIGLLFFPAMLSHVGRLSNEPMSYGLWAAAYYFILCWYQNEKYKHLLIACILCAIMLTVRVSAIVPIGTLGVLALLKLYRKDITVQYFLHKQIILCALVIAIGIVPSFGRAYYYKYTKNPRMQLVIGNLHKDPFLYAIRAKNSLKYLTYVDVPELLARPYVDIWERSNSRMLFWNAYVKTSLFGWFKWPNVHLAQPLPPALGLILALCIFSPLYFRPLSDRTYQFLYITYMIGIGAQWINRILAKTTVTHNGRMTFAIYAILFTLAGYILQRQFEQKRYTTAGAMVIALIIFAFYSFEFSSHFAKLPKRLVNFF